MRSDLDNSGFANDPYSNTIIVLFTHLKMVLATESGENAHTILKGQV